MVKIMETPIKIHDLGGPPLFLETPTLKKISAEASEAEPKYILVVYMIQGKYRYITGWWQLKDFLFSSLFGEMIQFD